MSNQNYMIDVKFKKISDKVVLPRLAHDTDACMDVIAISKSWLHEHNCWEYSLGFSTGIPEGYKGVIVPRSSISKYDLIMCNSPAQIDSQYIGPWKVRFKETQPKIISGNIKIYNVGDKIAQIFFEPILPMTFSEVVELEDSERGSGGFGSTGK